MNWIKIDRDESGMATYEPLNKIVWLHASGTPVALLYKDTYKILSPNCIFDGLYYNIKRDINYTHYLPIPKFKV